MKVYLVYFSPGGSTQKTVRNIAKAFQEHEIIEIDMLKKKNREKVFQFEKNDLVILGMMTATKLYGVPYEVINALKGNQTPLIGAVTCGNGYFGKSLIVMKKAMEKRGFKMIAGGGFVGKYSLANEIATNRPDARDATIQLQFGKDALAKLEKSDLKLKQKLRIDWPDEGFFSTFKCAVASAIPGLGFSIPKSWNELEVDDNCVRCGVCVKRCPTEAISLNGKIEFDRDKCIGCQACVNKCPESAIQAVSPKLKKAVANVTKYRTGRKEPKLYL